MRCNARTRLHKCKENVGALIKKNENMNVAAIEQLNTGHN